MTITELCAAGCASILVPYPHATDEHQTANAKFLADRDAAILLPQTEFVAERVKAMIEKLDQNRELLCKMAIRARRCAMPNAAETVRQLCIEAIRA